ncbi:MAG: hypothetical protein FJW20_08455 [Acidimicrobiia bacterium]|nr:hypothetical protein [Acidimicrobiia bacterium]
MAGSNWTGPTGEWLERNWRGDGTLAFVAGEQILAPDAQFPEFLPVLSPAAGAGVLYLKIPGANVWKKFLGFSGSPWDKTGRCPVSWWMSYLPRWKRSRLDLVASPEVELWTTGTEGIPTLSPEPFITILRVSSLELVPDPDSPQPIAALIGTPLKLVNGVDPNDLKVASEDPSRDLSDSERYAAGYHVATVDPITVHPGPNRVSIVQDNGQWSVHIKKTSLLVPGGFAYQILPVAKDESVVEAARRQGITPPPELLWLIELRIVYSGWDVEITVEPKSLFTQAVDTIQEWLLPVGWVSKAARLEVRIGKVDLQYLPPQGSALPENLAAYRSDPKSPLAVYGPMLEAVIGFIPLVGTVADVVHLTYMAAYGENFWGDQVSETDILLQAGFALVGVVADFDDAAKLIGLEPSLFKAIPGELFPGAKLVSTNPGLLPWLKEALEKTADPLLLEVAERNRKQILLALEDYSKAWVKDPQAFLDAFKRYVADPYLEAVESGAIAGRMAVAAVSEIHPTHLDGFQALPWEKQKEVLELWNATLSPPETRRDLFRRITEGLDAIDPTLKSQFDTAFQDWRMLRVFSADATSFRSKLLDEGFRKYKARGGLKNAVQWAAAQRSGKYYDHLRSLMGREFKTVLRDTEEYWKLTPEALRKLETINPSKFFNFYEAVREVSHGLGKWFQVDHVMEQRFIKNHPVLKAVFDTGKGRPPLSDVMSILVPANQRVDAQLSRKLNNFPYIHAQKTQYMRQLIPHGKEADFNLLDVFDAHVIVMKHQLDLTGQFFGDSFFDSVLKDQFIHVVDALLKVETMAAVKSTLGVDGTRDTIRSIFLAEMEKSLRTDGHVLLRNPKFFPGR